MNWIVNIYPYKLNFIEPGGTSRGVMHTRMVWYVRLSKSTTGSHFGIGECAPLFGLSCETIDQLQKAFIAVKADPDRYIQSPDLLQDTPSLQFALEMALLDYNQGGKRCWFDTPFFHGEQGILINGLIWMGSHDQMLKRIQEKLSLGFRCLKLKIGAIDFDQELDLIKHIRAQFSPQELELRLDANGAFTASNVMQRLEQLSAYTIHSIEQPVAPGQYELMARVCERSPIPIALDEELIGVHSIQDRATLLDQIKPHYIILKPSLVGGFKSSSLWIQLAKQRQIGWWATSALESNIGLDAISQWVATLQPEMPQGLGTGKVFSNNVESPLFLEGAQLYHAPHKQFDCIGDISNPSITLDGVTYSASSLDLLDSHPSSSEVWFQEICSFLKDWFNEEPTISIHTSGSTGVPKQITLSKELMRSSARATNQFFHLKAGSHALLMLSAGYVAGKMMLVRAIVGGYNLYLTAPASDVDMRRWSSIDFVAMVPLQFQTILQNQGKEAFRRVAQVLIGGAPLAASLEKQVKCMYPAIYVSYGMTETASHVALRRAGYEQWYQALPGINFSQDSRGCLAISASWIGQGVLQTNDVVELNTDKSAFIWRGRYDFVINSGGVKLHPEEIERKLSKFISSRFYLTKREDDRLGEKLVLVIEHSGYTAGQLKELNDQMEKYLSKFETPREILFMPDFQQTESGKIKRILPNY